MNKNEKDYLKFLNPNTFYRNFILSSLYITGFDLLKNSIIKRIEDFYCIGFDKNGIKISDDYKKEVLDLDEKRNKLNSSLLWLKKQNIINQDDLDVFEKVRLHRNELAHETIKILTDSEKDINVDLLVKIKDLLKKIDQWFIIEVELQTDPDMTEEKWNSLDRDNVQSMNMIMFDYMVSIIFNPSDKNNDVYESFKKKLKEKYGNIEEDF
jgi:hypothetical protein